MSLLFGITFVGVTVLTVGVVSSGVAYGYLAALGVAVVGEQSYLVSMLVDSASRTK